MSKKVEKKIDELINMVGNNESVVVIYKDEKDNVHYFDSCKDGLDIAATIATVLRWPQRKPLRTSATACKKWLAITTRMPTRIAPTATSVSTARCQVLSSGVRRIMFQHPATVTVRTGASVTIPKATNHAAAKALLQG